MTAASERDGDGLPAGLALLYAAHSVVGLNDDDASNVGERVKGKRRKYCPHEVTALVLGVQRYADDSCPWSSILRDPHLGHLFHGRSGVDLKDKWRTLIKTRPELSQYTENRKNHRKYRPFTASEERALIDGVKKYKGQRNVWSMILVDEELGPLFNDRSNVQLKDKYRTMRRSGAAIAIIAPNPSNRRSTGTPTSVSSDTPNSADRLAALAGGASARPLTPTSAALSAALSADGGNGRSSGGGGGGGSVTAASQQAANLIVQSSNAAAAAMFDPTNMYLAGSFSLPQHAAQHVGGINLHQLNQLQHQHQQRQQQQQQQQQAESDADAAQAQAQAIAHAARAQLQAQQQAHAQHLRSQSQQAQSKQFQMMGGGPGSAFGQALSGYQAQPAERGNAQGGGARKHQVDV
ncbi:hypothetical protein PybrP1_008696 [[Pythium] brassicae (nom. inval.)]|nr:hypothetical protein PybrP1_008696 [[Pythium] brassicae (nom. inval.)]